MASGSSSPPVGAVLSQLFSTNAGVSQGSVIAPILFFLFIDNPLSADSEPIPLPTAPIFFVCLLKVLLAVQILTPIRIIVYVHSTEKQKHSFSIQDERRKLGPHRMTNYQSQVTNELKYHIPEQMLKILWTEKQKNADLFSAWLLDSS